MTIKDRCQHLSILNYPCRIDQVDLVLVGERNKVLLSVEHVRVCYESNHFVPGKSLDVSRLHLNARVGAHRSHLKRFPICTQIHAQDHVVLHEGRSHDRQHRQRKNGQVKEQNPAIVPLIEILQSLVSNDASKDVEAELHNCKSSSARQVVRLVQSECVAFEV